MIYKVLKAIYFWMFVFLYSARAGYQLRFADFKHKLGRSQVTREEAAHNIGILWARSIFGSMKGSWQIKVEGKEHLLPGEVASIFVCNHQSMTDIWALYFLDKPFRWMAKDTLFKLPFIGFGMSMAGYIPVKRNDQQSRLAALDLSKKALGEGASMLFFPEGTRSRDGKLLPFRMGAFKLARDLNIPLQPIVIDGAQKLLEKHTIWPGKAMVHIKVLPAIYCQEDESAENLRNRAKLAIETTLQQLRLGAASGR